MDLKPKNMNLTFFSLPAMVKAILYDGTNYEEVVQIIKLNNGNAKWVYLDKNNRQVAPDIITEQKGIWFRANGNGKEDWVVAKDVYIIMDSELQQMYPCDKDMFEKMHVTDPSMITNGQHTFHDLYRKISEFEPTLEEILVTDKVSISNENPAVQEFIKSTALVHTDSAFKNYYVINGIVYVD
jgi:hypothetical protein